MVTDIRQLRLQKLLFRVVLLPSAERPAGVGQMYSTHQAGTLITGLEVLHHVNFLA